MMMNRQEAARALAKILAYQACGKDEDAYHWMIKLVIGLGYQDSVLDPIAFAADSQLTDSDWSD